MATCILKIVLEISNIQINAFKTGIRLELDSITEILFAGNTFLRLRFLEH